MNWSLIWILDLFWRTICIFDCAGVAGRVWAFHCVFCLVWRTYICLLHKWLSGSWCVHKEGRGPYGRLWKEGSAPGPVTHFNCIKVEQAPAAKRKDGERERICSAEEKTRKNKVIHCRRLHRERSLKLPSKKTSGNEESHIHGWYTVKIFGYVRMCHKIWEFCR